MRRFTATLSVVLSLVLSRQAMGAQTPIDLERYKAELRAKGEKLLGSELALPLATNSEEMASRSVFEKNTMAQPEMIPKVRERTISLYVREAWKGDLRLVHGTGSWPELEKQVAAIEPQLKLIRRALEHPAPDWGKIYDDQLADLLRAPRDTNGCTLETAANLLCATICALHRGDTTGAFENMHALASMPRLFRNELAFPWQLNSVALSLPGISMTWEWLQAPGLSDGQLAVLQHDWEQFNALDAMERGIMGQRAYGLACMLLVRRASDPDLPHELEKVSNLACAGMSPASLAMKAWKAMPSVWPVVFSEGRGYNADADELVQLEYYQKTLSAIRMLRANQRCAAAEEAATDAWEELKAKLADDKKQFFACSAFTTSDLQTAVLVAAKVETERRLAIAAIAIKRYELKHGSPPIELSALVPAYLAAVPIDPMNGKPLRYQIHADHTFALYSVGLDGVDNGGDTTPEDYSHPGMWERDVVWPTREISSSRELSSNGGRGKGN